MLTGRLRGYTVPLCYLAGLAVVSLTYQGLTPGGRSRFSAWASTNVANLATRPVTTMAVSGLIAEEDLAGWLLLTGTLLVLLVRRFGNLRAAVIVTAGHVVGTLVSEGIVALRIHQGALPGADRTLSDVGPSYIAAAALVAVIVYSPALWQRAVCLVVWLATVLTWFDGLTTLAVAPVGHLVAMIVGVLLGGWFAFHSPPVRKTSAAREGDQVAAR